MTRQNFSDSEFQDFLNANDNPPRELSQSIFNVVHRDLNPSPIKVFIKVLFVHIVMGGLSIFGCPQFGITPSGNMAIMKFLERFGNTACAVGCGAFFVLGTIIVIGIALRPEELKALRRAEFLQLSALLILSIGFFYAMASSVVLSWVVPWLIGSLGMGVLGIELLFHLRNRGVARAL